jgi:hypothetical protein
MNIYKSSLPYTQITDRDQRRYPRKMFRQQASLGLPGQGIITGYTLDISMHGLSVLSPISLKVGEVCSVRFNIVINGQTVRVAGAGKVANCSCAGDGFRIGMHFKAQDPVVQAALFEFTSA